MSQSTSSPADQAPSTSSVAWPKFKVGLLTGCQDRPYAFGLAMALASKGVCLDVVGGDEIDSPEFHADPNLTFLNLGGRQRKNITAKLVRLVKYYTRLVRYAAAPHPRVLHVLWHNKIEYFDRTVLLLYYKLRKKKLVFTAHNVNQARRDANDTRLNRLTLKIQYRLVDHIFVHTQKMKTELIEEFDVRERAITVIRHPINNAFPNTDLTPAQAKQRLGIREDEKTILFYGRIKPYKGLELLLEGFRLLLARQTGYRLIIAGAPNKGDEEYLNQIKRTITAAFDRGEVIQDIRFIPDAETEVYLKAADVLALPYKEIFQSGVLFLAYSYGLPVVAADVGSFREEIVEGHTGFLCQPNDSRELASTIETYFESDLYRDLTTRRQELRDYAHAHHSWNAVAELTLKAYTQLTKGHVA